MPPRVLAVALGLAGLVLAGCGDCSCRGTGEPKQNGEATPAPAPMPADGKTDRWEAIRDKHGTGGVTVSAVYSGEKVPKVPALDMSAHKPQCADQHKGPVFPESHAVNSDRSVPWVFVHVSAGKLGGFRTPDKAERLDQKGCVYRPHVLGVVEGQPLWVLNSDRTSHNVRYSPVKSSGDSRSMAPGQPPLRIRFPRAETGVPFKCDVHSWMSGFVHVLEHPWFTTTGEKDGTGEIRFLKPGQYTLSAWHETFKTRPQEVLVQAGEQARVVFEMTR